MKTPSQVISEAFMEGAEEIAKLRADNSNLRAALEDLVWQSEHGRNPLDLYDAKAALAKTP